LHWKTLNAFYIVFLVFVTLGVDVSNTNGVQHHVGVFCGKYSAVVSVVGLAARHRIIIAFFQKFGAFRFV
jgi:hypothetical protein